MRFMQTWVVKAAFFMVMQHCTYHTKSKIWLKNARFPNFIYRYLKQYITKNSARAFCKDCKGNGTASFKLSGWPPLALIDTSEPARSSSDAVSHIDSGAVDAGQSPSWQAWRTDSGGFKQRFVRNMVLFQTAWILSVAFTPFLLFWLHGTNKH